MDVCSPTYSHNLTFFIFVSHHLENLQLLNTYATTIWIIKCLLQYDISERMARRTQHSLRLLTNTSILHVTTTLRFYAEIHDNTWKKRVFPVVLRWLKLELAWATDKQHWVISDLKQWYQLELKNKAVLRLKQYCMHCYICSP